jgi:epoxyqueuosine reductase
MGEQKEQIRAEALRLGFMLCGFARARVPEHADFVRRWLAEGNAAEMRYIGRGLEKRLDPALVLPGTRTLISVAYPYRPPPPPPTAWKEELRGRIAAYALGSDYHDRVKALLEDLGRRVRLIAPNAAVRPYVDTGPVLEREWGAVAGIGWFGKNTNLLHRRHGSWFFIGELLTDLDLEPDEAYDDHCGTCTQCLDLCPTQALRGNYVLDARRCISYWTIEHRGAIPPEFRPQIENWVFGCDVCQEVCPWNDKTAASAPAPGDASLTPRLAELMALDAEGFRRRFGRTAVQRARRQGLLRNAAVVLGNTGNPEAMGVLAGVMEHEPSALVRAHAAWALGRFDRASARRTLDSARRKEPDAAVVAEIDAALHTR